jgi:hypothetical protein
MTVTCPSCKSSLPSALGPKKHRVQLVCKCKAEFICELVRIRAKRSRGQRGDFGTSTRDFDVRVLDPTGERLIQFVSRGWEDFELRAKDQVVFAYQDGRVRYVHNLTIGTFYDIPPRTFLGTIATIIIFLLAALVVIIIASAGHHSR